MIRYGHSQVFRFLLATKVFPFAAKCGMIELAKKSKLLDKLEFDIDFFVSSAIIYPVNIVKAMKSDSRYLEVLQRVP